MSVELKEKCPSCGVTLRNQAKIFCSACERDRERWKRIIEKQRKLHGKGK